MTAGKRFIGLAGCVLLALTAAGCGKNPPREGASPQGRTELTVFAAASLTETLTELGERYMQGNSGVRIVFNFDSSGTLKTQIQEGAECDLFLSAAQKQMDQLDKSASREENPEGLDFVLEETRLDLLENQVVLVVPEGSPAGIASFEDLMTRLEQGTVLMSMGNGDVPAGQYTQRILEYFGLNEEELAGSGAITYASNVKEVTAQVAEGAADCGVVYRTDAFSAGLTAVDAAEAEMCGRIIYPAAVIKTTAHPEEAKGFLKYLTGEEAAAVFESVGFTPVR